MPLWHLTAITNGEGTSTPSSRVCAFHKLLATTLQLQYGFHANSGVHLITYFFNGWLRKFTIMPHYVQESAPLSSWIARFWPLLSFHQHIEELP
jgi:hypothetical protein